MLQLLETIKIYQGVPQNLSLHGERMNRSRQKLFGCTDLINLQELIKVPAELTAHTLRCRIIYDKAVNSIELSAYTPARTETLVLVDAGTLDYSYKYLDRACLNALLSKDIADDILIVKNSFITDTSYANIVFTDGKEWITPDTPLLNGTMREKLLRSGLIREASIKVTDLKRFTHFRLINAMLEFDAPLIPLSKVLSGI
jgi:4-amino-4-deoxychorismate lyase